MFVTAAATLGAHVHSRPCWPGLLFVRPSERRRREGGMCGHTDLVRGGARFGWAKERDAMSASFCDLGPVLILAERMFVT